MMLDEFKQLYEKLEAFREDVERDLAQLALDIEYVRNVIAVAEKNQQREMAS